MTDELHEGQVLQERFVLDRALLVDASSQLWLAHDRHLDASLLLRIHRRTEGGLTETIARDARRHRRLHHPHVARLCDVHNEGDLLFASIVPPDGELLSTVLERTGPMPYRQMIEKLRPLVDALVHLHEHGGEHGRIDLDHVLVDHDARWILLPGDGTRPARSDMTQLGRLVAVTLTGGSEPDAGRPLNDLPDRLHRGRTVPALLDQLVGDLRVDDPALRPAGMRDVVSRLDQLEEVIAAEPPEVVTPASPEPPEPPEPAPPPAPPPSAPPPPPPRPRRKMLTRSRLVAGVVVLMIIGGLMLFAAGAWDGDEDGATAEVGPPDVATTPTGDAGTTTPPEPDADVAAARAEADQALSAYLVMRQRADEIGAVAWAGPPYEAAAATAAAADAAYLAEEYATAVAGYRDAAAAFEQVAGSGAEMLPRLLAEGNEALDAVDAARATSAFQSVLMIDPGNDDAEIGLKRASTIEELDRMLTAGLAHEAEGRLALAHVEYAAAAQLDPRSEKAAAAYARIKDMIADEQFQAMMARALDAFHRRAYDEARDHLLEARRFRPDAVEVDEALAMIDEARVRDAVDELRAEAETHEQKERWQEARNTYRRVLAIDASVRFAQEGKQRCEAMLRLEQLTRHYLDNPDLLITDGSREDAVRLVAELEALEHRGARLDRMYERLAKRVRLATTPLRVVLHSDEKTEVDVYRVGRYGTFDSLELTLLPGVYTVVGHRTGYKDVRLELHLEPGARGTTLTVRCTEAI